MSHSTTARLRHQIFRLNQGEQADLDFGLGEILPPEDLTLILTEEGATWKSIIYTPLLTTWAFLWQMLSPDRSCRAAVKRIAAWLSSQGKKLANDEDDPYIKTRQRLPETVPLRLMKHIGRRCHERAENAWRWCNRTVKSVNGFNGEHARHVRQSGRLSSESVSGPRIGLSTGAVGRRFLPGNGGCVGVGDRPCPWQENRGKHPVSQPLGQPGPGRRRPG